MTKEDLEKLKEVEKALAQVKTTSGDYGHEKLTEAHILISGVIWLLSKIYGEQK